MYYLIEAVAGFDTVRGQLLIYRREFQRVSVVLDLKNLRSSLLFQLELDVSPCLSAVAIFVICFLRSVGRSFVSDGVCTYNCV